MRPPRTHDGFGKPGHRDRRCGVEKGHREIRTHGARQGPAQQHSGHHGTQHARTRIGDQGHRHRVSATLLWDQVYHERLSRGAQKGKSRAHDKRGPGEDLDHESIRRNQASDCRQHQGHAELADDHHPTFWPTVGKRTSERPNDRYSRSLGKDHVAHRSIGAGNFEGHDALHDHRHEERDERKDRPDPQDAKFANLKGGEGAL